MNSFGTELYIIEILRVINRFFNLILNFVPYWT